jgi:hypothetical protein
MDLPGVAIGGVSVGEGHDLLVEVTSWTTPLLPEDKPRYLMGVGLPEDVLAAIGLGIDMFDCVIPTRYARSATVFTRRGRVRLTNRRYRRDAYPIDPTCDCATCAAGFTRAYLHHLFAANEILSAILASVHNVRFYQRLVGDARRRSSRGGSRSSGRRSWPTTGPPIAQGGNRAVARVQVVTSITKPSEPVSIGIHLGGARTSAMTLRIARFLAILAVARHCTARGRDRRLRLAPVARAGQRRAPPA